MSGPRYKVPFRRRREGKTNYYLRRKLLASRKIRFVPRFSAKCSTAQFITTELKGDVALVSVHSHELKNKYGWKACGKNVPASYLIGLLSGLRAHVKGIKEAILDIGLRIPSKGSRPFAAVKGALDAGITIPINEEVLPDESRIQGKHIAAYAEFLLKTNPSLYEKRFSKYLTGNLRPEDLPEHFREVKEKIWEEVRKNVK